MGLYSPHVSIQDAANAVLHHSKPYQARLIKLRRNALVSASKIRYIKVVSYAQRVEMPTEVLLYYGGYTHEILCSICLF